jgi:predicted esterase
MAALAFARVLLLGTAGVLALGCGDESGADLGSTAGSNTGGNPGASGSSAGTSTSAGAASAGSSTGGVNAGGVAGTSTTGGSGAGGASGAETGGMGSGGMIDANGGAPAGPASGRQTARPSGTMPGTIAGYYEYLPPHYGNGALYPLLVFRHGIGENGNGTTDLDKILVHGPPKLIKADKWPEDRKFVVLSVQHPGGDCPSSQEIDDFIGFATANYDIDPKRVYLTGLSCGAIGSWNYLGDHLTEDVAAAVLIAGDARGAYAKQMCNLGTVPIWAFHGDKDPTVLPEYDGKPIASLKTCTSPAPVDLKYTVYPGVAHDSWTMTYDLSNPANDIYAWLMTHTK